MKANEAPEKLYFDESDRGILDIYSNRDSNNDIEYTRTDALIDKACEYIITHIPDMHTLGVSAKMDECIIKNFRTHMKGE